ncbi:FKBP-type peptidyl-prolyl cis-trans isomerase [Roseivirga sp.]|uniref:FKBP-type peptidyl-prolyl cis-trans isomerase n=1 Tax=Roseivirga sp. TaxID=1964215 RepID=UPI003B8E9315
MKRLILVALLVSVYACNGDDLEPYDPIAQLEIDLNLIDMELASTGQAVKLHTSGIRYFIENEGEGVFPTEADSVLTHYEIYTLDGELLDTSVEDVALANGIHSTSRDYDPFLFEIGTGVVIEGYEIGTKLLNKGAYGTFYVPSTLAYRSYGQSNIGPNQVLRIKIQLEDIL